MKYRKLSASGDMTFGSGSANFWTDTPEAPAQAVMTKLRMRVGEWFLDTTDGTAWNTRVLGNRTTNTRDIEIRSRILSAPGISGITEYGSTVSDTRALTITATLNTLYGRVNLSGSV